MGSKFLVLISLAAVAALLSCSSAKEKSTATNDLTDHDPVLAYRLVQEGALLLDVRTPAEYEVGHIKEARLIPVQEIESRLQEIEQLQGGDKGKPIVVHCQSGHRASRAKEILLKAGFKNITNLGGISDWPGGR